MYKTSQAAINVPYKATFNEKMMHSIKMFKRHWQLYLLLLLPIAYIIIFNYIPMYGIIIAFKNFNAAKGIFGSPWVGLDHFIQFFKSPSSITIIVNTVTISLYSLIAGFPIPIILAVALNEIKNKSFKKTVQMVTYAPHFISTVVMVGIIFQLLDPRIGLVNQIIRLFGGETIDFIGVPKYFKSIYVWSGIWQGMGFSSIIYLAALSGVSPEQQEACIIDGATRLQKIWHVDIACIRPTIVILLIMSLGGIMNVGFEKVLLMQNALNQSSSEIIGTFMYKVGLVSMNFSFSTAVSLFNTCVNYILLVIANSIARKVNETSLW